MTASASPRQIVFYTAAAHLQRHRLRSCIGWALFSCRRAGERDRLGGSFVLITIATATAVVVAATIVAATIVAAAVVAMVGSAPS